MDPTLHFLWSRRSGGRPPDEPQKWAISLLERGIELEAILQLAAESSLDRQLIDDLVTRAIRDLKLESLLDDGALIDTYERASVQDYFLGLIDGETLILRGCDLYRDSGEPLRRQFWLNIADGSDGHGGQGIYGEYRFDKAPFDEVLKDALAINGFEPSGQGGEKVV